MSLQAKARPQLVEELGRGKVLTLAGPGGSALSVTEHGGHAFRWHTAGGEEWLFLSPLAEFTGSKSIRGGVPVVFPQFAELGPLPKHGLLRDKPWALVDAAQGANEAATAHFRITDDASTLRLWPHPFQADLRFELGAEHLTVNLAITNTGAQAFTFTTALHTYFRVDNIDDVRISGLQGLSCRDSANGGAIRHETADSLAIVGEVDRIYFNAPARIELSDNRRQLQVQSKSFTDAVIWNPGPIKATGLKDLDEGGWRRFICIESAVIGQPVHLSPGQQWKGSQTSTTA